MEKNIIRLFHFGLRHLFSDNTEKLTFPFFFPSSYVIKAGQRVRLAVAGTNPKDFLPLRLGDGVSSYELTLHVNTAGEGQGGGGGGEGGEGREGKEGGIGLSRLILPTVTKGDGGAGNGGEK